MRDCGTCKGCCIAPAIEELQKLKHTPCKHLSLDPSCRTACGIYTDRPAPCSVFRCLWLQGRFPAWAKPDKIHVMFTGHNNPDFDKAKRETLQNPMWFIQVWELKPGASKKRKVAKLLDTLTAPYTVLERTA